MAVVMLMGGACSVGSSTPQTTPTALGTVKVQMSADYGSLSPFQAAAAGNDLPIIYAVYDRLVSYGAKGQIVPYLASSWTSTPTSLSFTLKKGPTCPDGTPITPTVVKNSFALLFANKPVAAAVFGAGPYTMTADDATGLFTINLGTPNSSAIYNGVMSWPGSIVCPAGLADPAALAATPAGSGPYSMVSAVHGGQVVLKKRSGWAWGPDGATASALPDTLIYQIVTDSTTASNLLITGGLDMVQISGIDTQRLLGNNSYTHQVAYNYVNGFLGFNEFSGVGADKVVRQALLGVIDPKAWLQAAAAGQGQLSPSYEEPAAACYDASVSKYTLTQTIAQAQSLLKNDGYTLGSDGKFVKNGQPLAVRLFGINLWATGDEYIAGVWGQLGVTVTLADETGAAYLADLTKGNFTATTFAANGETPDPSYIPRFITGQPVPAGTNLIRIKNPELDSERAAALASSGTESCAHWAKAQALVLQNFDLKPLANPAKIWFARKGLAFQGNLSEVMPYTIRST